MQKYVPLFIYMERVHHPITLKLENAKKFKVIRMVKVKHVFKQEKHELLLLL